MCHRWYNTTFSLIIEKPSIGKPRFSLDHRISIGWKPLGDRNFIDGNHWVIDNSSMGNQWITENPSMGNQWIIENPSIGNHWIIDYPSMGNHWII